ncbi:5-hydroxytryptamine receptor-like [Coccinella septempunctata]|uniref:5-hydroxytryptamine receptor-like n=1 Tax=Coccinella septempunctata TaxID=41139 RepID=UPI001D05EADB|nr:5-hydroxytryptamine receptor-like [Coccinella septempunctata]
MDIPPGSNFVSHHGPNRTRWKANIIYSAIFLTSILSTFILATSAEILDTNPVLYRFLTPDNSTPEGFNNCSQPCLVSDNGTVGNLTNKSSLDFYVDEPLADIILLGFLSLFLGLMILVTIIGNVFVIAAILLEKYLQNVANYLVVSLAVADLMVACLVMPLGAVYVISNNWIMGPEICDLWTSTDVLCCTASILHLVAIAVDRYWAVTNVDYIHTRNSRRIGIMIVIIWGIALIVSLAPQIPQFKDPDYIMRIEQRKQCIVSQDLKYQIFATSSTFYVPLFMIFILYWKIFQAARKQIRKRRELKGGGKLDVEEKINNNSKTPKNFIIRRIRIRKSAKKKITESLACSLVTMEGQSTTTMEIVEEECEEKSEDTTAFTISKPSATPKKNPEAPPVSNNVSPEKSSATTNNGSASHQSHISDLSRVEIITKEIAQCPTSVDKLLPSKREKKETLEAKRERKAAKTLAIITGAFVVCWLPFFILALVLPLCKDNCNISDYVMSFASWLGYFNSALNPVLYTIFNPEFRQAFKVILCGGRRRGRNMRSMR